MTPVWGLLRKANLLVKNDAILHKLAKSRMKQKWVFLSRSVIHSDIRSEAFMMTHAALGAWVATGVAKHLRKVQGRAIQSQGHKEEAVS